MEVLSPVKKRTQALEMVSEAEEEEESEHEEGEISSEEEEEEAEGERMGCPLTFPDHYNNSHNYPPHFSFPPDFSPERRPAKKGTALTSEVVIYDDTGRTAIFTSPKKARLSSYLRPAEGSRSRVREAPKRRKRSEVERGRRRRASVQEPLEKSPRFKRARRSTVDSGGKPGGTATSEEGQPHSYKAKDTRSGLPRSRRPRQARSDSTSGSSSSFSCTGSEAEEDSDSTASSSPRKGRGKENRRCGPATKGHDRSPPQEYGCERPPTKTTSSKQLVHRSASKHSSQYRLQSSPTRSREFRRKPSYYHDSHRSSKDVEKTKNSGDVGKTSHHRTHQKFIRSKSSERKAVAKPDSSDRLSKEAETKGQKRLPPGSLGEMLNEMKKNGTLKVQCEAGDNSTLDQEDEEELQLRLIAIKSSIRLLSDMQKVGQQEGASGAPIATASDARSPAEKAGGKGGSVKVPDENTQSDGAQNHIIDLSKDSSPMIEGKLDLDSEMFEFRKSLRGDLMSVIDVSGQNSDDVISISSSSVSEICVESLATNKSYMEASKESSDQKGSEELKKKIKERSDCDQNPVDMEICDTSGEDEGDKVAESSSPEKKDTLTCAGMRESIRSTQKDEKSCASSENPLNSNIQIPVEWAYMLPPPPPPDQPANDLHNINNWCFDQNMYLQTMQTPLTSSEEYRQCSELDAGATDWSQAHSHSAHWGGSFMDMYESNPSDVPMSFSQVGGEPKFTQHALAQSGNGTSLNVSQPDKDLKNLPAEQYQAFMSALLQQQNPIGKTDSAPAQQQNSGTKNNAFVEFQQRTLIQVPLNDHCQSNEGDNLQLKEKKLTPFSKTKKLRMKKKNLSNRRLKKQALKQSRENSSNKQIAIVPSGKEPSQEASALQEDEDEDLLRAQLLIDMSRKKEQRTLESLASQAGTATTSTLHQAGVSRLPPLGKESSRGSVSPLSFHSLEVIPAPKPSLPAVPKSYSKQPRSTEGSPTHTFKKDASRPGLSDIGGWGLDPKSSKFSYHNSHDFTSHSDAPKIKFPPIKPVIISLASDSEDEEEGMSANTPSQDPKKEVDSEVSAGEPMSQSIDILLKSMRNANTSSKEASGSTPKPGPSTSSCPPASTKLSYTTPQAVRHLSRHQQEEYRWLKEQLRKKELLQRKKLLQRPAAARSKVPVPQSPLSTSDACTTEQAGGSPVLTEDSSASMSPSKEMLADGGGGEGLSGSSSREVTWKDMGLLQIHVSNDAAYDVQNESEDSSCKEKKPSSPKKGIIGGDSSMEMSATEDEDEDTLRMMALLTQKKKAEKRTMENQHRRVVIGDYCAVNGDLSMSETKDSEEEALQDGKLEDHQDEVMREEWMVLDEVREEGNEVGETELCTELDTPGNMVKDDAAAHETSNLMDHGGEELGGRPVDAGEMTCEVSNNISAASLLESNKMEPSADRNEKDLGTKMASKQASQTLQELVVETGSGGPGDSIEQPSISNVKQITRVMSDLNAEKAENEIKNSESKIGETTLGNLNEVCSNSSTLKTAKCTSPPSRSTKQSLPENDVTNTQSGKAENQVVLEPAVLKNSPSEAKTKPSNRVTEIAQRVAHSKVGKDTNTITSPKARTIVADSVQQTDQSKVLQGSPQNLDNTGKGQLEKAKGTQIIARSLQTTKQQVREANLEKCGSTCVSGATQEVAGREVSMQQAEKSNNVKLLHLNKLEKEYMEKRSGINKMIAQLGPLLQEVNEEQQQRQALKKSVAELRAHLKDMEAQLETKSSTVQAKMELIRHLQQQLGNDRQAVARLEQQGKGLGRQVYGSSYSLPKALASSPQSKTRDTHMKKTLASSINALRQQMRDLTKKRNGSIRSGADSVSVTDVKSNIIRTVNIDTKKGVSHVQEKNSQQQLTNCVSSAIVGDSQATARTVLPNKSQSDPSNKTLGRDSAVTAQGKAIAVKRKASASNVPMVMKIAKTQAPKESGSQERAVGGMPTGPNRLQLVDSEKGDQLDEMNELCPYDLLGRCNDDSCTYQHLAHPRLAAPTMHTPATPAKGTGTGTTRIVVDGGGRRVTGISDAVRNGSGKTGICARVGKTRAGPGGVGRTNLSANSEKTLPNTEIGEAEPQTEAGEPEPKTKVGEPEPKNKVGEAESQTKVGEAEPQTEVRDPEPQTEVGEQEPQTEVGEEKLQTEVQEVEPQNEVGELMPQTEAGEAEPQARVTEAKLQSKVEKPESQAEAQNPHTEAVTMTPQPEIETTKLQTQAGVQASQIEAGTTMPQTEAPFTEPQIRAGSTDPHSETRTTKPKSRIVKENIISSTHDEKTLMTEEDAVSVAVLELSSDPPITRTSSGPVSKAGHERREPHSLRSGTKSEVASRGDPDASQHSDNESSGCSKGTTARRKSLRVRGKTSPKPAESLPKRSSKRRGTRARTAAVTSPHTRRNPARP